MNIPKDLKYTRDHEWVRIEGDVATIGISNYAQEQLGDIVFVEIETEGEDLKKGEVFGTIEAVKTVSDMFMPISGTVVKVNEKLMDAPDIVNNDPYNEGWMIQIKVENVDGDLDDLLDASSYEELLGQHN